MGPVDLNKLHTFLAVVENGGVSAASRRLGLTRSAVSQSVSSLEASLGVRLFHRVGKRLVLTDEGQRLHSRFGEYRSMLERTLDELRREEREVRGQVRLGLFVGFSRIKLARLVARFTELYPAARVKLLFASRDELNNLLLTNRVDFVLSFDPPGRGDPRVRSTRLFRQELILVSGKKFFRSPFDLTVLEQTPVIDYYQSDPLIDRWVQHHFPKARPRLTVRSWAATTDLVLDLILHQAGVGVVPDYLAESPLRRRRLRLVVTGKAELADFMWLNELEGSQRNARLAAFRSLLLRELSDRETRSILADDRSA